MALLAQAHAEWRFKMLNSVILVSYARVTGYAEAMTTSCSPATHPEPKNKRSISRLNE
jgi:hypothetical protein